MKFTIKFTNRTFTILAFVAACGVVGASFVGHASDPADDFSFTISHAPRGFGLMSEKRVTEIFQDRLDLFPLAESAKLSRHLIALCRQYRFDPAFVLALIQVESSFKIKARSPVGAVGLMQLMPATAQVVARQLNLRGVSERGLTDPYLNLSLGVAYLAYLRDHYRGLPAYYIVGAYNVGPARMDELRARKSFRPVTTKKYYEAIRQGLPGFHTYRRPAAALTQVRVNRVRGTGALKARAS